MDDVDKAIVDRFRQAGPSLIKLEQRSQLTEQFMACCWDPTVLSLFPPGLEVGHLQYATSAYFDDPGLSCSL